MSRFILAALAGMVLLTGCPSPDGGKTKTDTSDQPSDFTTQTSVTLRLTGAVLRVDHVETALFKIQADNEVAVPNTSTTIARDELPKALSLTDLKAQTTYRFKAQAYDTAKQAVAAATADIVVSNDSPPPAQSLALAILEVPFAGSISHQ